MDETGDTRFDAAVESSRTLERLLPRLEEKLAANIKAQQPAWTQFKQRLEAHFPRLLARLVSLYSSRYDFFFHLEVLMGIMAEAWLARSPSLKALDQERERQPDWFQSQRMLGGVCYVDLFAGGLAELRQRIPYFQELGLNYLHLMPLFRSPEGDNDGGYAISSYHEVDPALGTMQDLRALAEDLRSHGISLVLDFVFNHTSSEHAWALRARKGDPHYQAYYRMFPDRAMPDAYEAHLREIFPEEHPGAFTYFEDLNQWVWTTFHSNQWDLNYANPEVFNQMAAEMLFLANQGVEILRLDAVAFIWKSLGTSCENLPEAHQIIQAYNAVARIAAPSLLFKSEAIVHPDDVARYIHPEECQLSYNPLLMALLWNTLATREVGLLRASLERRFAIPESTAWVNYVRCHDDIGWTFSDEDAAALGINAHDHRRFLNAFYTGQFEGSFGRGLPFQENPRTGDARISGTCASLAGLEKALNEETSREVDLAIRRILLIHNIILTVGGIPLIYLGDEVGMLNDYRFRDDPSKSSDSRWVHRLPADPLRYAQRNDQESLPGRIYLGLRELITKRQQNPLLAGGSTTFLDCGNPHLFGYIRQRGQCQLMMVNNFSDHPQSLPQNSLRLGGLGQEFFDELKGTPFSGDEDLTLQPFEFLWLSNRKA